MDSNELKGKVRNGMDMIIASSKKAIGIAGNAVQEVSDKSVIRIEKSQLESKLNGLHRSFGKYVAERLTAEPELALSASDEKIAQFLKERASLKDGIAAKTELLKKETKPELEA